MSWTRTIHRLSTLSPWTTLLLAAFGGDGGDKRLAPRW